MNTAPLNLLFNGWHFCSKLLGGFVRHSQIAPANPMPSKSGQQCNHLHPRAYPAGALIAKHFGCNGLDSSRLACYLLQR
jgi:hypothetical protein